ncbi:gliding motility-associated C-terminal domain-containing protein [Pontibacter cellulosilyticus]|uniref:Gliding motility-associated C-terminal domain-containing protein n=1 Tax=Pontibacter cellulosilyticus TaxID=1720253 RepID=A0A923N5Q7_9BACT|nr:gliding motility-associated C-terminal domain-containing protein [Pontibacter cellulosilyticus]MBC5993405.1 gliding motility-associated C-terminal domain-containing protein [Pontibacter cellulosilyticus]
MRILLPFIFFAAFFIGIAMPQAVAQCVAPSVSFPAGKSSVQYCGPTTVEFSTNSINHKPTYTANGGTINSYSWKVNGIVTATVANPIINFPNAGTYTVTVTATSTCGNVSEVATQSIVVEGLPDAPLVEDVYACQGSKATLWVQDARDELIYRWYTTPTGGTPVVWGTSYTTGNLSANVTLYVEAVTQSGCVSATRTEATAFASSIVGGAQSIGSDQEICAGVIPAMLTGAAPTAGSITYQWYHSTTNSLTDFTPIATGRDKDYQSPALNQTTWFKRVAYRDGCAVESNVVKITVNTPPATPVASNVSICSGNQATLRVENPDASVVYRWYASATSTTVVGSGTSYVTPTLTADRSYWVEASTTSATNCFNTTRTEVKVIVTQAVTNNSITAGQAICSGGTPSKLIGSIPSGGGSSSGVGGYIYQWQRSEDGTFFTDIPGANAPDYAPPALQTTTWYRRKVRTSSPCPEIISNAVKITVTPLPVSINIVPPSICTGTQATLVITNPEEGFTYRWYDVAAGSPILGTGTSYTTVALTSGKTYYVDALTADGCITTRSPVDVTVLPLPQKPVVDPALVCQGSSATLVVKVTDPNLFYRWFDESNTLVASGTSYTTPPLSANATYHVEAVTKASPGCASSRTSVEVTISAPITNNTISGEQQICNGATPVSLTGSLPVGGSGGYTYQWERSEDGTFFTALTSGTGKDYAPGALTTTTWYRRKVRGSGPCPEEESNIIRVTVNPLPTVPVVNSTTICTNTSTTLSVVSPDANVTYKWYLVATAGTPFRIGTTYTTETLTSSRTYYVEAVSAEGCVNPTRRQVTVNVTPLPNTPQADNTAICAGSTATLTVLGPDATLNYKWYSAPANGTLLATGTSYTTGALSASTTVYVEAETAQGCTSPSRRAVYIDVTPLPAIPEAGNATICAGDMATLFINNPDPTVTYKWYDGSNLLTTGISYTTDVLTSSTSYFVEAVSNTTTACASPSRRMVTVTVIPTISNNTVSGTQTICSGSTPARLPGTLPNGGGGDYTYQWERSEDGVNFTNIAGAVNQDYAPGALTITTWYRRKVKGNSTCPEHVSSPVKVTVAPLPATPAANNVTVCAGENATLAILSPDASLTYKWYTAATGGSALATGVTFTTSAVAANTTYYVDATSGTGCVSSRKAILVSVRPLPDMPLASDKTICAGQKTTLSVTSPDPTLTYRWYNTNGTLLATGTTYNTDFLSASTTYYLEASNTTNPVCTSPRKTVVVTVNPQPTAPIVPDATTCAGATAALAVQSPDATLTYRWYTVATGGTPVATGTTYTTPTLTSGSTYYVEAVSGTGCASSRVEAVVNVTPLPATPAADNVAVCEGAPAELNVRNADPGYTYRWYTAAAGGTLLATGTNYTISSVSATTTYYLEAVTSGGCVSPSRAAVTVSVTSLPATPDAENVTICAGDRTTLWVINPNPGMTYRWYDGTSLLATGVSYTTNTLTSSATYYLEAVTNTATACVSPSRKAVTVTVTPGISNNSITADQSICSGITPAQISGALPAGGGGSYTYQWERSEDGVTFTSIAGATNQDYTPGALTISTWYRRKVKGNSTCPEHTSNAVKVTVSSLPATPNANAATVCYGESATLNVSSPDASLTYKWYAAATGGSPLASGTSFATGTVTANTTFYVEATNTAGCVSSRRPIAVTVRPLPEMPQASDKAICAGERTTLTVASPDPGLTYRWFASNGTLLATGTTYTTDFLNASTTYFLEASNTTNPVCTSPRKTVVVTVNPQPTAPTAPGVTACAGSTAELAVQTPDAALVYKWYTAATGGTPIRTGTTYTTPALTSASTYYVEAVSATGCVSTRTAVAVTVTPLPATPAADNLAICAGAPAELTVTDADPALTYRWYTEAAGGTLLATGNTYTIGSLDQTTTYYLEAVTANGCASASRATVTVDVTPLPATPEADNATICAGDAATLWVKNPSPSLTYRWYAGSTLVGTGLSYTTNTLINSATYYLEAVSNTATVCTSPSRRTVTVTVTPGISNNSITANQTICSGTTPTALAGSVPTGGGGGYTFQWERSEDGTNFTAIASATAQNYTPGSLTTTTWFRRKVKAASSCPEQISNVVQVIVSPLPAMPAANNATVCQGATATLSVASPNAAFIYRWYTSASGGSSLATGDSYTTVALENTATYYVEAVSGTGCTSPRKAITVTVTATPETPEATDKTICAGQTATLAVTAPMLSYTYRWYNSGGTLVATGTSFTTPALSANATYYVEAVTGGASACVSSRKAVAVNVTALPAVPTADDVTICAATTATLSVKTVEPGITYNWYTVATGGAPVANGTSFTTGTLTSNRTYYLEAVSANGCASPARRAVAITVTPQPAQPSVPDYTVCYGERVTMAVASPDGTVVYRWYDRTGAPLATGISYTTDAQTASTTFYVEAVTQTSPACVSPREAVNVNVTTLPATPVVDNTTICTGGSTTLFVKNASPSAVYKWYDDNETLLATGTTLTTATLTNDAIYYVVASTASGCVNPARAVVTVSVTQQITNNSISADQTICSSGTPSRLGGSQPGNTNGNIQFQWESSEDGTNFTSITNATGRDYQPTALNVTTWFRRKVTVEGSTCAAHYSNVVKVTTIALPLTPAASNVTICAGAQANLRVSSVESTYTYRWFETATGGNSIATGESFAVDGLTADKTYYVEAMNANGCISPRKAVTIYVTPLPATPQAADKMVCAGGNTTLSVTNPDTKLNYRWFDASGALVANSSSFTTQNLTANTVYFVEAYTNTAQACASQRKMVNVSVTALPTMPEADDAFVCAGGAATLSVKQPDAALTYRWYSAATGGTPLSAQPTLETGALTSDRTYFVEAVNAAGCVSPREAVNVSVTQLPAEPLASNKAICAGQLVELSVNQPDVNLTYRWFDSAGKLLATGNKYAVSGLTASATYYVEAMTATGCASPTRKAVVVSVSQLPGTPAVENAAICAGERVTLFVKNPDPTLEYRWYNDAAGTNLIGSGISYTSTDALYSGKSYFVEAVNTAGCASATRKQVDVRVTGKPGTPVVNDATVCAGASATLSITAPDGAMVYKWYDVNGTFLHTGTTYTTVPLSSKATFHVVANTTTTPACASDVEVVTVNITTPLTNNTISASQTICSATTPARLSGSMPNGGTTATITYQWENSTDGVNFVSIVGAYAQDYAPGVLTTDTWFRRVARAAGPCSETVSNAVKVTVIPLPATPVADNQRVCVGTSATLKVLNPSSTAENITYRWYNVASGGSALASGISFVTPALSANTTYYVEATNGNGCISSTRRAVQVLVDQPITNNTISSSQTVCTGSKAAALFGSQPDGGSGAYTYQWQRSADGANFTDISGATGQGYAPTEDFTKTTWFRRKVKAGGPCTESISTPIKIEVVFSPTAPTVTSAAICPGVSTTLTATAMAGLTVEWYDAAQGGTLVFVGNAYTTPVLNSTTSFWVQAVSSSGCVSKRQVAKVDVVGPQVTVSDDLTIIEGKTVQLSATGGAAYKWSPAEGLSDPNISTPVAKPAKTTTYVVEVTTREGCVVTKQVTVTVLPKIIITNVITPNADGYNDKFDIKGIENYPNATVEIYTRWGEQVFQSKGYPEAWNGTKNGNALPVGAYYYIIKLDATSAPISGSVTIVK